MTYTIHVSSCLLVAFLLQDGVRRGAVFGVVVFSEDICMRMHNFIEYSRPFPSVCLSVDLSVFLFACL